MAKNPETFKRGQRVATTADLPGVPAGTEGRVVVGVGLTWLRYRVHFDNGVELGSIDASKLARVRKKRRRAA